MESFAYRGFEIPVHLLQKRGFRPKDFEAIATLHNQMLAAYASVRPEHHVLDMGCGAREEEMPDSLENPNASFRFPHRWSEGIYVSDLSFPEGSVAVTPATLDSWLAGAGLRLVRPLVLGYWLRSRTQKSNFGQDVAVIEHVR